MMIIAVTGYIASGKDTLAEALIRRGFKHLSLSDLLRERLRNDNIPITRDALAELGTTLREELGDAALAQEATERIDDKNWVISSIGRVAEAQRLREAGATVIFVSSDMQTRYERLVSRDDSEDKLSYEDFTQQEERERTGLNRKYREFDNLKEDADIIIENNGTLEEFHEKINDVLKNL